MFCGEDNETDDETDGHAVGADEGDCDASWFAADGLAISVAASSITVACGAIGFVNLPAVPRVGVSVPTVRS